MAYYVFKEIWTPLKLIGIRFYREVPEGRIWVKIWSKPRRPLRRKRDVSM